MRVNAYRAYGLRIHAEIDSPELQVDSRPDGNPDVIIRLEPAAPSISETLENGYYEVRPGAFRLAVTGVGRYLVEDGKQISITPQAGASPEAIRLFLLGSAMGALLYQRGLFPLHGSAIETRWGAMIMVGEQGIGKSTLAAEFHRKGYGVLSDDVCAVESTRQGLRVLPAPPHFRLCADAYERLGIPQGARFNIDKFVVPINDGYCSDPAPLKAVHVLTEKPGGDPNFTLLRGFDRVQRLLENLYRPQYLKGQSTQGDIMRLAGQIAEQTAIVQVSRRRDLGTIENLAIFLERTWEARFGRDQEQEKN
jgi:hypothetical protein